MQTFESPATSGEKDGDQTTVPAPRAKVKPRASLCLPIILDGGYMAQIIIPADMSRTEMLRMRRVIWTLAVPRNRV